MKTFKIIMKNGTISYMMAESIEDVKKRYLKLGDKSSNVGEDYYLNLISIIEEY